MQIYGLYLNPMRGRCEEQRLVACAYSEEELRSFVEREFAPEPYKDGQWHKVFKPGSPLEWMNPPGDVCSQGIVSLCTRDEWLQRQGQVWDDEIGSKLLTIEAA